MPSRLLSEELLDKVGEMLSFALLESVAKVAFALSFDVNENCSLAMLKKQITDNRKTSCFGADWICFIVVPCPLVSFALFFFSDYIDST